jgi:hypothetical protein
MELIIINASTSIFDLVSAHPQIGEIMVELGFKDIIKQGMLQTMGRVMTLEKGAQVKKIEWNRIVDHFIAKGFIIQ